MTAAIRTEERTDSRGFVRGIVVVGVGLAVVVLGVAAVVSSLPGAAAPSAPEPVGAAGALAAGPDTLPTLTPIGPAADPDSARTSSEVENPFGPVEAPGLGTIEPEPLLSGRPPASASAVGGLVAGYPAFLPLVEGSRIETSAVSASGAVVQATLEASTRSAPADVVASYDTAFAGIGLVGTPTASTGLSRATAYTRGTDSVTLTVTPSATGGSLYTLFSVVTVAG